jgi:integrase
LAELEVIVEHMPEKWRALVLLAAWCGLRWGEATELRRKDLDLAREIVHVRRSVVRAGMGKVVKEPKSDAGMRDWTIPPHVIPVLRKHLARYAQVGAEGCCSRPLTAGTWQPCHSGVPSTRLVRRPVDRINGHGWALHAGHGDAGSARCLQPSAGHRQSAI